MRGRITRMTGMVVILAFTLGTLLTVDQSHGQPGTWAAVWTGWQRPWPVLEYSLGCQLQGHGWGEGWVHYTPTFRINSSWLTIGSFSPESRLRFSYAFGDGIGMDLYYAHPATLTGKIGPMWRTASVQVNRTASPLGIVLAGTSCRGPAVVWIKEWSWE
jgi:hypothetical protein